MAEDNKDADGSRDLITRLKELAKLGIPIIKEVPRSEADQFKHEIHKIGLLSNTDDPFDLVHPLFMHAYMVHSKEASKFGFSEEYVLDVLPMQDSKNLLHYLLINNLSTFENATRGYITSAKEEIEKLKTVKKVNEKICNSIIFMKESFEVLNSLDLTPESFRWDNSKRFLQFNNEKIKKLRDMIKEASEVTNLYYSELSQYEKTDEFSLKLSVYEEIFYNDPQKLNKILININKYCKDILERPQNGDIKKLKKAKVAVEEFGKLINLEDKTLLSHENKRFYLEFGIPDLLNKNSGLVDIAITTNEYGSCFLALLVHYKSKINKPLEILPYFKPIPSSVEQICSDILYNYNNKIYLDTIEKRVMKLDLPSDLNKVSIAGHNVTYQMALLELIKSFSR